MQRIYRRDEWNAVSRDETDGKKFESPISRFILMHTVTNTCQSEVNQEFVLKKKNKTKTEIFMCDRRIAHIG